MRFFIRGQRTNSGPYARIRPSDGNDTRLQPAVRGRCDARGCRYFSSSSDQRTAERCRPHAGRRGRSLKVTSVSERCRPQRSQERPSHDVDAPEAARDRDLRERSEEHTSELQSPCNLVCRLLLEKKKTKARRTQAIVRRWPPAP